MAAHRSICEAPAHNPGTAGAFTRDRARPRCRCRAGVILAGCGTDTAFIRRTRGRCAGICRVKPTYGWCLAPAWHPPRFSLDHIGAMAWDGRGCAIHVAGSGGMIGDPASRGHSCSDYRRRRVPRGARHSPYVGLQPGNPHAPRVAMERRYPFRSRTGSLRRPQRHRCRCSIPP